MAKGTLFVPASPRKPRGTVDPVNFPSGEVLFRLAAIAPWGDPRDEVPLVAVGDEGKSTAILLARATFTRGSTSLGLVAFFATLKPRPDPVHLSPPLRV